jgi:hypothetical protein
MKKENILLLKKIAFTSTLLLLFCLSSCKEKTNENTLCGQVYYEMAVHQKILGECSVKVYKAEGISINLITAAPAHVTTPNSKGYYEFKRMLTDDAWWLVASVNYIDTTDATRKKQTCEKVIGLYDLSENTKKEVDIYLNIN